MPKVIEIPLKKKVIKKKWNFLGKYSCGRAKVKRDGRYNFINENGKIISKKWFTEAAVFFDGYALVQTEEGANLIDIHGRLQSKIFFEVIINVGWDGFFGREFGDRKWKKIALNEKYEYFVLWEKKDKNTDNQQFDLVLDLLDNVAWMWRDGYMTHKVQELFN